MEPELLLPDPTIAMCQLLPFERVLGFGEEAEVLEPEWFRERIKKPAPGLRHGTPACTENAVLRSKQRE